MEHLFYFGMIIAGGAALVFILRALQGLLSTALTHQMASLEKQEQATRRLADLVETVTTEAFSHISSRTALEASEAVVARHRAEMELKMQQEDHARGPQPVADSPSFIDTRNKVLRTPDGRELEPLFP